MLHYSLFNIIYYDSYNVVINTYTLTKLRTMQLIVLNVFWQLNPTEMCRAIIINVNVSNAIKKEPHIRITSNLNWILLKMKENVWHMKKKYFQTLVKDSAVSVRLCKLKCLSRTRLFSNVIKNQVHGFFHFVSEKFAMTV